VPQPLIPNSIIAINNLAPEVETLIAESLSLKVWNSSVVGISAEVSGFFGILNQLYGTQIVKIAEWIAKMATQPNSPVHLVATAILFAELVHTSWRMLGNQDKEYLKDIAWMPAEVLDTELPVCKRAVRTFLCV